MRIIVNIFSSTTFTSIKTTALEIEPCDIIQLVKGKIEVLAGIPYNQQRIIYAGRILDNGRTVADYDIVKNSILYLFHLYGTKNMYINVRTPTGKTITLNDLAPSHTIRSIKAKIETLEGIPRNLRQLMYYRQKEPLEDGRTLAYYHIRMDAVLTLRLHLRVSGTYIFVKLLDKTISLEVRLFETVQHLKDMIQDKEGISSDQQQLFYYESHQKELDNKHTLAHYNIKLESIIYLVQRDFSKQDKIAPRKINSSDIEKVKDINVNTGVSIDTFSDDNVTEQSKFLQNEKHEKLHAYLNDIQNWKEKIAPLEKHKFESVQHDLEKERKLKEEEIIKLTDNHKKVTVELNQRIAEQQSIINDLSKSREEMSATIQHKEEEIEESQQARLRLEQQVQDLQKKLTKIRNSWKISTREVTLTNQEIGRGAWGVVTIGLFRGQKVAVKKIHDSLTSQYHIDLIKREINIMAQLRHPNLLQFIGAVFDHSSGNPMVMIITEVMDTSLRRAYEDRKLTPEQRPVILSIMRDVAVGLNYLHCLPDPIIHRDVNSANVLLESKGPGKWKTKISDFGSANLARLATTRAPGAIVYSAPECFPQNSVQTPHIDVYSYGTLLCEVLTCCLPIDDRIFQNMLDQVKTSEQSKFLSLFRNPPLYSLINSCRKTEPQKRPIIRQVIEELDRIIMKM